MHLVMMMSLVEVFEPELEVEPPVGVPELAGAAWPDVGVADEPVVGVAVEPVGAGVSPPAAPVVADIIRQRKAKTAKERDQRGSEKRVTSSGSCRQVHE